MNNILKNSLGLTLCISAILRFFICSDRDKKKEMFNMHLPINFSYIIPFFEIFIGIMILKCYNPQIYYKICLFIFLFATCLLLMFNFKTIDFKNSLLYHNNGPSIMFHLSGCVILLYLIFKK